MNRFRLRPRNSQKAKRPWSLRVIGVEQLEPRELLSFDPTPMEQAFLEDINRVRMDPQGELDVLFSSTAPLTARDPEVRGAMQFFRVDGSLLLSQWSSLVAAPPLAWNEILSETATDHNLVMQQQDQQEHVLPGEESLGDRIRLAGYDFRKVAENIYAFAEGHIHGHAGFVIDWGDGPGGIQSPAGHRDNIMDPELVEIGIDVLVESDPVTSVGPYLVTQDFGQPRQPGDPFILGVAWDDLNFNGIYDPGEGIKDVNITITGDQGTYTTTSMTAGGYQVNVPNGVYQVLASGGGLSHTLVVPNVVVSGQNVKADFNRQSGLRPPVAANDSISVSTLDPVPIPVLDNDSDPDGTLDPTTVTIAEDPIYGSVQVDPTTGVVTYQVGPTRSPDDVFLYTVRDSTGAISNVARVTVGLSSNANQPPVASEMFASLSEDQPTTLAYQTFVSDSENSLDWSSVEIVTNPQHGSVTVDRTNRTFNFSPATDYFGLDLFTYRIADTLGLYSPAGNVRLRINPVNDAPTAASDQFVTDANVTADVNVLGNDLDIDDALTSLSVFVAVDPQHGNLAGEGADLRYVPEPGFTGLDAFVYQAVDAAGENSELTTARIYVTESGLPWRNPANALDVDGDEAVSPLDALLVINHLGVDLTAGGLPSTLAGGPTPFVDVVGDNLVSPLDALFVINQLGGSAPTSSLSAVATSHTAPQHPVAAARVEHLWSDDEATASADRVNDAVMRTMFA